MRARVGEMKGQERAEKAQRRGRGLAGTVRSPPQEPEMIRGVTRGLTRKNPNRERLGLGCWWWDGTPHQTTIESTEATRCGLLPTQCELDRKVCRRDLWPWTIKQVLRPDWLPICGLNLVCLPVQFNSETGIEPASVTLTKSTPIYTHSSSVAWAVAPPSAANGGNIHRVMCGE